MHQRTNVSTERAPELWYGDEDDSVPKGDDFAPTQGYEGDRSLNSKSSARSWSRRQSSFLSLGAHFLTPRQYSTAHASSALLRSRIAASTRASCFCCRAELGFLHMHGFDPHPVHKPRRRRREFLADAGLRAMRCNLTFEREMTGLEPGFIVAQPSQDSK